MTPDEYKKNIHVRLAFPLIGLFTLSLIMTIFAFVFVYSAESLDVDLYGNYQSWIEFRTYAPFVTVILFITMIANFKKEPDDPRWKDN